MAHRHRLILTWNSVFPRQTDAGSIFSDKAELDVVRPVAASLEMLVVTCKSLMASLSLSEGLC